MRKKVEAISWVLLKKNKLKFNNLNLYTRCIYSSTDIILISLVLTESDILWCLFLWFLTDTVDEVIEFDLCDLDLELDLELELELELELDLELESELELFKKKLRVL